MTVGENQAKPATQETLSRLATSVPFFAFLVAPLGVAGQNIGLGVALLLFITLTFVDRGRSLKSTLSSSVAQQFLILWMLIVLPITLTTVAKGDNHEARRFFWGYLYAGFIVIAGLSLRAMPIRRAVIFNTVVRLIGMMGLIALSQVLLGWKIEGIHIVDQIKRAQGFYSHPLTFAYAALVLMPWCFARAMAKPKQWQSWVLLTSMLALTGATQSITVTCVSGLIMLILMTRLLSMRQFMITALVGVLLAGLAVTVPNPVQKKFHEVLSGQRSDRETPYPDDRMAFWHAHWEMIKEAPFTGHGTGMDSSDRQPYYEKIGLPHIKRMYEAHNMYLQYAAEGGIIAPLGLLAFLIWWGLRLRNGLKTESWYRLAMMLTPLAFAMGGLTQNAIQDSEVRYILLLSCAVSLWFTKDNPQQAFS